MRRMMAAAIAVMLLVLCITGCAGKEQKIVPDSGEGSRKPR